MKNLFYDETTLIVGLRDFKAEIELVADRAREKMGKITYFHSRNAKLAHILSRKSCDIASDYVWFYSVERGTTGAEAWRENEIDWSEYTYLKIKLE